MKGAKESKAVEKKCFCPYCDEEIMLEGLPYCQPCGVTLHYCASCHTAVPKDAKVCPECGGKLEDR